jgi:hypothetical protein
MARVDAELPGSIKVCNFATGPLKKPPAAPRRVRLTGGRPREEHARAMPNPPAHPVTEQEMVVFLDRCRQLQSMAATLCQEGSGLPVVTREGLRELRHTLLKVRKLLGPVSSTEDVPPADE